MFCGRGREDFDAALALGGGGEGGKAEGLPGGVTFVGGLVVVGGGLGRRVGVGVGGVWRVG